MSTERLDAPPPEGAHLVVIGAGGNIGSHLVVLLARMIGVVRLTLLDMGVYESGSNLTSQDAGARDVGRTKVSVQARRARRANPALHVAAIHADVESVPLGVLRGDVILAGLDSRRARQIVNEASRQLGIPWIDAGVFADESLVRVSTYSNSPDAPCMECPWSDQDYAAVEQSFQCGAEISAAPTGAPAWLGALAAAVQAAECARVLTLRAAGKAVESRELILDVRNRGQLATTLRSNPACRLSDHSPWRIDLAAPVALDQPLSSLAALMPERGAVFTPAIVVARARFQVTERCFDCGAVRTRIRVLRSDSTPTGACKRCGSPVSATGLDIVHSLPLDERLGSALTRTLRQIGVRAQDILTLRVGNREQTLAIDVGAVLRDPRDLRGAKEPRAANGAGR